MARAKNTLKRWCGGILTATVLLSCPGGAGSVRAAEEATRVFRDTFDDNQPGEWTGVKSGVTFSGGKMVITAANATEAANARADRLFTPTTQEKATIFFDLAKTSTANSNLLFRVFSVTSGETEAPVLLAVKSDGKNVGFSQSLGKNNATGKSENVELYSVSGTKLSETKLKLVLDFKTQTFDFYAKDMSAPKKTGVAFRFQGGEKLHRDQGVKKFTVQNSMAIGATVDNLAVYDGLIEGDEPAEPVEPEPELETLTVDGTALEVVPAKTDYKIIVPEGTESVRLAATGKNGTAAMNPADGTVTLINGAGTGTVTVTGADGTKTKTYTVSVVTGKNVALGKPVTAAPAGLEGFGAENITDGVVSPSSRYDGGDAKDVLTEIDFGGLCEVGSIDYTEFGGGLPYRTDHLTVSATADGKTWTDVVTGGTLKDARQITIDGQTCFQRTFLFSKAVKASRLRVRCENTGAANAGISILEIMAYGAEQALELVNDTFSGESTNPADYGWTLPDVSSYTRSVENGVLKMERQAGTAEKFLERDFSQTEQDHATVSWDFEQFSGGGTGMRTRVLASGDGAGPIDLQIITSGGKAAIVQMLASDTYVPLYTSPDADKIPKTNLKFVLNFAETDVPRPTVAASKQDSLAGSYTNLTEQCFDFYVDGELVKEGVAFRPTGKQLNDVARLTVSSGRTAFSCAMDNLKVTNGIDLTVPPKPPKLLRSNHFHTGSAKWKTLSGSTAIVDGQLSTASQGATQYIPKNLYLNGNAVIEFDTIVQGDWAGLQFQMDSAEPENWDKTGYLLSVTADGKASLRRGAYNSEAAKDLAAGMEIPNAASGQPIHVKLEYLTESSTLRAYFNNSDDALIDVTDNAFTRGYLGLASNGKALFDNVSINGVLGVEPQTAVKAADAIDLIEKPLRDTSVLKLPKVADGYTLAIESTSPTGIIANDGSITRPTVETDVAVTFRVTGKQNSADTALTTLTVPISPPYTKPAVSAKEIAARKEVFKGKNQGLFTHYVPGRTYDGTKIPQTVISDIDVVADEFDAAAYAADAHRFGFQYVQFTVMHANACMLYPSETNRRWRDERRLTADVATFSQRDVIMDLYNELQKYGIELHLYVHPVDGHDFQKQDQDATGWNDCDVKSGDHVRWNTFINELFDELCRRYAGKISGLWFDGVYSHTNKGHALINHTQLRTTVTAYDPTITLVSNIGTSRKTENLYATTDYSAWEVTKMAEDPKKHRYSLSTVNPDATNEDAKTWPGTSQQVAAAAVKGWWATKKDEKMPYTAKNMFLYTVLQSSISVAGGYNIAACCFAGKAEDQAKEKGQEKENIWENEFYNTMIEYHDKYLAPVEESVHDVHPGKAYVTAETEWLAQKEWGVSTETPDGQYVYLHVVNPPAGDTLTLAEPADKSVFMPQATILNLGEGGMTVPVTKLSPGYSITLPEGTDWDTTDTVIKLQRASLPYEITSLTVEPGTDTQKKVTAQITRKASTEKTPSVIIASYSAGGRLEEVETKPLTNPDGMTVSTELPCPAGGYFKAFVWNLDANQPLAMPAQTGAD